MTPSSPRPGAAVPQHSVSVEIIGVTAAVLAILTSLLGLLASWPYAAETASWRLQAHGQDLGNLLAAVVLLAGLPAFRRGRPVGWVAWIGSLLYLVYVFVIYAFGVRFGPLFPVYVAALGLAGYALLFSLAPGLPNLAPRKSDRFASGVVAVIAVAFALLWLGSIGADVWAGRTPAALLESGLATNPVQVLDLALILPGMLITVIGTGRQGRVLLLGAWLVFSVLMSASIVITLVLSAAPSAVVAVVAAITVASAAAVTWQLQGRTPADAVS